MLLQLYNFVLCLAALWVGGIPDYIAKRGGESNEGVANELGALLCSFGKLDHVRGRFKPPGVQHVTHDKWMGGSWGLVTFVAKCDAEKAMAQGVQVPIKADSTTPGRVPVPTGYLVIKKLDQKLAAQSPMGRIAAEQNVAMMERALTQYKGFVRSLAARFPVAQPVPLFPSLL